jgi:alginate O-acetyltransferase complex protein AlgI
MPVYSKSRNLGIALLSTMVAIGLWHEFSVRYLLWGAYHGLGLLIWRWFQRDVRPMLPAVNHSFLRYATTVASIAITMSFVLISFTITRSDSFDEIIQNFRLLLGV